MKEVSKKIREDEVWKNVYKIVRQAYAASDEITSNFPNEEWYTASKLKNAANDSLFYLSQAVGSADIAASKYEYNTARKEIFALQSMYIFASKQKFIELDPSIVVSIDQIIAEIDKRLKESDRINKQKTEEELEPWLEKYRLWQKINS